MEQVPVAKFLRTHPLLKQRTGINSASGSKVDFFRYKRCIRALLSDSYAKKVSKSKGTLPEIKDDSQAQAIFIQLIKAGMILPVDKLSTQQARAENLKPVKGTPFVKVTQKAVLQGDKYFIWNFQPSNPLLALYSVLGVIAVFAVILFPLWPAFMRKGVWYLSTGLLGLIGLFFLLAIVRLIIFCITVLILPNALWIFPNLFEDVGFFESFQPLYGFSVPKEKSKKKSKSKGNGIKTNGDKISETTAGETKSESTSTEGNSGSKRNETVAKKVPRATIEEVYDE
ncbi:Sec63 complex subunit [Komagataella phaffii CBS 7435]|uniref:Translocation protein SEC62 n=2 Tax=Komagataella phaffii TaxID=460519 RepID=C4R689_KOMPG|nr:Essential subunit of Sec63 complex (Sec63p, Sec62p, Sec66p and Sec72p) [Komagataella phaffii GS115]AOA64284.1 GQ67_04144T0 [Komagataella phaffii]CAH2449086.1 Sec63 complex subunit [Komagataella phaffii CBS 7435]AOA68683.1 GQ68_04117T0 [Komagataella phaffii GS115]CAY71075.1 Essential subunit of Sec63 complex (Sec63p, Sec62p, Sec66p and Sec72p) [Komagataella phaffii GS115]CCA39128.1 Sec63 complex subunit [Komagataella phaffii CBS 7435]